MDLLDALTVIPNRSYGKLLMHIEEVLLLFMLMLIIFSPEVKMAQCVSGQGQIENSSFNSMVSKNKFQQKFILIFINLYRSKERYRELIP